MSAAINARSAKSRACVAARLLKTVKPWPTGYGMRRNFDDCFEMGDGGEVFRLLILRAANEPDLLAAIVTHGYTEWADKARSIMAALDSHPTA
jgi:hypothetical protein